MRGVRIEAGTSCLRSSRLGNVEPLRVFFKDRSGRFKIAAGYLHLARLVGTKHLASTCHHAMLRHLAFSTVYVPVLSRCSSR